MTQAAVTHDLMEKKEAEVSFQAVVVIKNFGKVDNKIWFEHSAHGVKFFDGIKLEHPIEQISIYFWADDGWKMNARKTLELDAKLS